MRRCLMDSVCCAVALILACAVAAQAQPYAASAEAHDFVTVSGLWSSVQWYESDGCYSGVGDPAVVDWKDREQNNTPIDLSTSAGDANGSASSTIIVNAAPAIEIDSYAEVHGLVTALGHWAMGYSEGGANWLTSGGNQTVTITVDYSYDVDLTQAHPNMPYAYVKICVAFWDGSSNLMLTPDTEFVSEGSHPNEYLVKEVMLETAGSSTGTVTGSKSWDVNVVNGGWYSFWSQADASVWTPSEPTSCDAASWSDLKALYR